MGIISKLFGIDDNSNNNLMRDSKKSNFNKDGFFAIVEKMELIKNGEMNCMGLDLYNINVSENYDYCYGDMDFIKLSMTVGQPEYILKVLLSGPSYEEFLNWLHKGIPLEIGKMYPDSDTYYIYYSSFPVPKGENAKDILMNLKEECKKKFNDVSILI